MPKTSLHPTWDEAWKALHEHRELRETNSLDREQLAMELPNLIKDAREINPCLKWRQIAEAAGVSRSYVMRVWKESNGEKP
jgi:predicted XRE-type DNA-binding protein